MGAGPAGHRGDDPAAPAVPRLADGEGRLGHLPQPSRGLRRRDVRAPASARLAARLPGPARGPERPGIGAHRPRAAAVHHRRVERDAYRWALGGARRVAVAGPRRDDPVRRLPGRRLARGPPGPGSDDGPDRRTRGDGARDDPDAGRTVGPLRRARAACLAGQLHPRSQAGRSRACPAMSTWSTAIRRRSRRWRRRWRRWGWTCGCPPGTRRCPWTDARLGCDARLPRRAAAPGCGARLRAPGCSARLPRPDGSRDAPNRAKRGTGGARMRPDGALLARCEAATAPRWRDVATGRGRIADVRRRGRARADPDGRSWLMPGTVATVGPGAYATRARRGLEPARRTPLRARSPAGLKAQRLRS